MKLVEIQNSNIRQYYYDVIKELQGENEMNEFMKGAVCLGLVVVLFVLADYFKVDNLKDLF